MTTNKQPWDGDVEVRVGRAGHACLYIQGTNHDVAIGMKPEDAEWVARALNTHIEVLEALTRCAAVTEAYYGRQYPAVQQALAALAKAKGRTT